MNMYSHLSYEWGEKILTPTTMSPLVQGRINLLCGLYFQRKEIW